MNRVIIFCFFLSITAAAVIPEEAQAKIVKYENVNDGSGTYRYRYETSNGILREESGNVFEYDKNQFILVVHGSYSYKDPNGELVTVHYTADENGFHYNPAPGQVVDSLPPAIVATLLGG